MSLVGEHMSLVIHVYLVGICNSLLVEEHISLGICVSLVGEHMSLVIWGRGRQEGSFRGGRSEQFNCTLEPNYMYLELHKL